MSKTPALVPLSGDRWTPFVQVMKITGADLTGATIKMQVRLLADTAGAPLADLNIVGSVGTEGVAIVGVETIADAPVSTISIRINEATMEAMPAASEVGDDAVFAYDMHVTLAGGIKERWLYGPFTVRAGVTQ